MTIVGVALGLLVGALMLLTYRGFALEPNIITLSDLEACNAVEPRTALSSDGAWLASVWVEGDDATGACQPFGKGVLRWASQNTSSSYSWQAAVDAFPGTTAPEGSCVAYTDVQVEGDIAHVVASIWSPCLPPDAQSLNSYVRYRTYNLDTGSQESTETIASYSGQRTANVRLVLDDDGRAHVAYGTTDILGAAGEIWYVSQGDTGWNAPAHLSDRAPTNDAQLGDLPAYKPDVAWSQGRAHVVWEGRMDPDDHPNQGVPLYRYCDGGTCTTAPVNVDPNWDGILGTYPAPVVEARDGRVLIAWHYCSETSPNPPCELFQLIYLRSDTNGGSLNEFTDEARQVGSDDSRTAGVGVRGSDAESTHRAYLQPILALKEDGNPVAAWQSMWRKSGNNWYHLITTTHAIADTGDGFTWNHYEGLSRRDESNIYSHLKPAIAVPHPQPSRVGLHLVYMKGLPGNVSYDVMYAYLSEFDPPTPTPTCTPWATETPGPSVTPEPSSTPEPGVTGTPTSTPTPLPTPTPIPTNWHRIFLPLTVRG